MISSGVSPRVGPAGQHVREVLRERHDAVRDVGARLFLRLREMHRPDEAPLRSLGRVTVLRGDLVPRLPVRADRVEALLRRRRDREQAGAVLARGLGAGRRDRRRDRDLDVRFAVRLQLQARVLQREPVGLLRDGLAAQQRHDHVERLVHARALLVGGDAEHVRVGGELARTAAEHGAAAREVVEQHEAIREHQRLVVGERVHAAAEPDVLRARRRGRDEHLGRRDDLVAARVVFADPHLVEAEAVEVLDQIEVAFERERRVLPGRVERGHEESEAHAAIRLRALTARSTCAPESAPAGRDGMLTARGARRRGRDV